MKKSLLIMIIACGLNMSVKALFDDTRKKVSGLVDKAKPLVEKGKAAAPHLKDAYDAYNKAGAKPATAPAAEAEAVTKTPAEIKAERDAANKAAGLAKQAEIKKNQELFGELPFGDDSFFD